MDAFRQRNAIRHIARQTLIFYPTLAQ